MLGEGNILQCSPDSHPACHVVKSHILNLTAPCECPTSHPSGITGALHQLSKLSVLHTVSLLQNTSVSVRLCSPLVVIFSLFAISSLNLTFEPAFSPSPTASPHLPSMPAHFLCVCYICLGSILSLFSSIISCSKLILLLKPKRTSHSSSFLILLLESFFL